MDHNESFATPDLTTTTANYNFWSNHTTDLTSDYFTFSLRPEQ